jgi:DNA replication protein DnaC
MPAHPSTNSRPISETLHEPHSQTVDAICPTHGAFVATVTEYHVLDQPTVITSGCPRCKAEKAADELARKQADEAYVRKRKVENLIGNSGVPARFADRSFANYRATEQGQKVALAVCKSFAEKWPEKLRAGASLVLTGGPGTGKTHLACAVANAVMSEYLGVTLFGTVASMLRHIKSTYAKDSQRDEQDAIDDVVSPDLLVLDEVGVQVGSDHEKLLMFEVLNSRYQELRPTILISNLNTDDLEAFLGQRVMDRYRECGSVLAFDWESYRGSQS